MRPKEEGRNTGCHDLKNLFVAAAKTPRISVVGRFLVVSRIYSPQLCCRVMLGSRVNERNTPKKLRERRFLEGIQCEASDNVYISVTEPVEPFGSTLYLFGQLRSFGSVGDRHIQ